MNWRSHFNATFFRLWEARNLPNGLAYAEQYDLRKYDILLPPLLRNALATSGPLAKERLVNVYHFGVLFAQFISDLHQFPLKDKKFVARSDWCGRFNLGISLFDWLCDEGGRVEKLLLTPPFNMLTGRTANVEIHEPMDKTEATLLDLAEQLLFELQEEVGAPGSHADPIWINLSNMLQAEAETARNPLQPHLDIDMQLNTARLKSSGPFRCMAERVAIGDDSTRKSAANLGDILGDGYWLMDDAHDLWEDLDHRRSNLFLLAAVKTDPELLNDLSDPDFEFHLGSILLQPGWVEGIVTPFLDRLVESLANLDISNEIRTNTAGCIATSMQRWLG